MTKQDNHQENTAFQIKTYKGKIICFNIILKRDYIAYKPLANPVRKPSKLSLFNLFFSKNKNHFSHSYIKSIAIYIFYSLFYHDMLPLISRQMMKRTPTAPTPPMIARLILIECITLPLKSNSPAASQSQKNGRTSLLEIQLIQ